MTSGFTGGTGYPDWERVVTLVADPLVRDYQNPAPSSISYGPFLVGAFPTVRVACTPGGTNAPVAVTLEWYADQALTQPVGAYGWTTDFESVVLDAVANVGPWLLITVGNSFNDNHLTTLTVVTATTANAFDSSPAFDKFLDSEYLTNYPPGLNGPYQLPIVTTGPVMLFAGSAVAAWIVQLVAMSQGVEVGVLGNVAYNSGSPNTPIFVNLPNQPVGVAVNNLTGAAGAFNYSVVLP